MTGRRAALALALATLLLAGGAALPARGEAGLETAPGGILAGEAAPGAQAPPSAPGAAELNPCLYYDATLLESHARAEPLALPHLRALVVPHYAPQLDLAARALMGQEEDAFERVIVIGPDHTGQGGGISLSGRGWAAPWGPLAGDPAAARALLADSAVGAKEQDDLLAEDHAAAIHMPYLARFAPAVQVAGLLVGRHTDAARLEALARAIDALAQERPTLVIFSVDFSHYQTPPEAELRDAETVRALEGQDLEALLGMDSANVDSPESLAVFLGLARLWGLGPRLVERRLTSYTENGRVLAGSFMLWALAGD